MIGSTVSTALAGTPWEVTRGKASSTTVPPSPGGGRDVLPTGYPFLLWQPPTRHLSAGTHPRCRFVLGKNGLPVEAQAPGVASGGRQLGAMPSLLPDSPASGAEGGVPRFAVGSSMMPLAREE